MTLREARALISFILHKYNSLMTYLSSLIIYVRSITMFYAFTVNDVNLKVICM
jgi:hypothetical protein